MDVELGREAYDAFLFRYPYCYGYWKKYADLEKKKGTKVSLLEQRHKTLFDCYNKFDKVFIFINF